MSASNSTLGDISIDQVDSIDLEVLGGLREVMEDEFVDLLETYLANAPELINKAQNAIACGDAGMLVEAAHTLKGSSSNLGIQRMALLSSQLLEMGRDELVTDSAVRIVGALEEECQRVRVEIEQYCDN